MTEYNIRNGKLFRSYYKSVNTCYLLLFFSLRLNSDIFSVTQELWVHCQGRQSFQNCLCLTFEMVSKRNMFAPKANSCF